MRNKWLLLAAFSTDEKHFTPWTLHALTCCSSHISQVRSWCFDHGERESEAGLDRPGPEAEHIRATGYPLHHADRGSSQLKLESREAIPRVLSITLKVLGQEQFFSFGSVMTPVSLETLVETVFNSISLLKTKDAQPLSVDGVQRETVEQVWVVSKQDRNKQSQACP